MFLEPFSIKNQVFVVIIRLTPRRPTAVSQRGGGVCSWGRGITEWSTPRPATLASQRGGGVSRGGGVDSRIKNKK